jgi:hypothetical protein
MREDRFTGKVASDKAGFINGETVNINGGYYID